MSNTLKGKITFGQGIQGPVGPQGPPGKDGTVKFDELSEAQIAQLKGPKGDKGERGDVGPQGLMGPQGLPGTVRWEELLPAQKAELKGERGERGIPGPEGQRGPQGLQGAQGLTGPMGPQGLRGEQGPQGQIGTLVYRKYKLKHSKTYKEWEEASHSETIWHLDNLEKDPDDAAAIVFGDTVVITGDCRERPGMLITLIGVVNKVIPHKPGTQTTIEQKAGFQLVGKTLSTHSIEGAIDYYDKVQSDERYIKIDKDSPVNDATFFINKTNILGYTTNGTQGLPAEAEKANAKEGVLLFLAKPGDPIRGFQYFYSFGTEQKSNKNVDGRAWSRSYNLNWGKLEQVPEGANPWTEWKKLANTDDFYSKVKSDERYLTKVDFEHDRQFLENDIRAIEELADFNKTRINEVEAQLVADITGVDKKVTLTHNNVESLRTKLTNEYMPRTEIESDQVGQNVKIKENQNEIRQVIATLNPLQTQMGEFNAFIKKTQEVWGKHAADDPDVYIYEGDGITGGLPVPKDIKAASKFPPGWGPGLLLNYYTDEEAGTGTQEWTSNANGNVYTRTVTNMKKKNGAIPSFGEWELLLTNKDVYSNEEIDKMFESVPKVPTEQINTMKDQIIKAKDDITALDTRVDGMYKNTEIDNKLEKKYDITAADAKFAVKENIKFKESNATGLNWDAMTKGEYGLRAPDHLTDVDGLNPGENLMIKVNNYSVDEYLLVFGHIKAISGTTATTNIKGFVKIPKKQSIDDKHLTSTKFQGQIDNANNFARDGICSLRANSSNLPDAIPSGQRQGILTFGTEEGAYGIQTYYPTHSDHYGRYFVRLKYGNEWKPWKEQVIKEHVITNRKNHGLSADKLNSDGSLKNANDWVIDGHINTSPSTANLPSWKTEEQTAMWGSLQFISENDNGNGYQLYNPIDGQDRYKFGTYKRVKNGSGWSSWQKHMTYEQAIDMFTDKNEFGIQKGSSVSPLDGYYRLPGNFIVEWHEIDTTIQSGGGQVDELLRWCTEPYAWTVTPMWKSTWNHPVVQTGLVWDSDGKHKRIQLHVDKGGAFKAKLVVYGTYTN